MAMTYAEWQRRHREKVEALLAAANLQNRSTPPADGAARDYHEALKRQYREAGVALVDQIGDSGAARAAVAEFLAQPVSVQVILDAVEAAGQDAVMALFEKHAAEYAAEAR